MVHKNNTSGHGGYGHFGHKASNSGHSSNHGVNHHQTGTRYVHSSYNSTSPSPATHVHRHYYHNNNNNNGSSRGANVTNNNEPSDSTSSNMSSAQRKAYRLNGSEYNQIVNGETEYLFSNKQLIENSTTSPLKSLRTILKQFEMIEKRQWPNFLHDLSALFAQPSFAKVTGEKPHRIVDDVTRILSRILTTKLFPDIIQGIITCLTNLSFALKYNCKDLHAWLFDFYKISPDETKLVLLRAVGSIVKRKGKGIGENMTTVMVKLRDALEETESQSLLLELVEIFVLVASNYPSVFQVHFSHIVDILIAWYLDSMTNPLMASKLAAAFLAFQSFWLGDISTTHNLLKNFIEDFETNYEALAELEASKNTASFLSNDSTDKTAVDEVLTKMAGLAEVYVTVFKSLGTFPPSTVCSHTFVLTSLKKILLTVTAILSSKQLHEHLVISCNDVCIFTLGVIGVDGQEYLSNYRSDMLLYLELVYPHLPSAMSKLIVSTLNLMINVTKYFGPSLPVPFVSQVIRPSSPVQKLRFYPLEDIQTALFSLHHTLLDLRSLPLLVEVYRGFLVQLQKSLEVLFKKKLDDFSQSSGAESSIEFNDDRLDDAVEMSAEEALLTVKSCVVSLSALANSKNNLIGLWALKPCLFDLIILYIDPSRDEFVNNQDLHQIQFMLLNLIYNHSRTHSHFVSSSKLLRSSPSSSVTGFKFEPPTSDFLMRLFEFLNKTLRRERLARKQRLLCIKWFHEILCDVSNFIPKLIDQEDFVKVIEISINLAFFKDPEIALEANKIANFLLTKSNASLSLSFFKKVVQSCIVQISHSDSRVSEAFCNLLHLVPLSITAILNHVDNELTTATSHSFSDEACDFSIISRDYVIYPQDLIMTSWALMKTEQGANSCFSPWYFQSIMAYVLDGDSKCNDESFNWLQRLFLLSQSDSLPIKLNPGSLKSPGHLNTSFGSESAIKSVFQCNCQSLLYWSVWQCVSFCIANKLKTPYGKPQDLLTRINLALNSLSNSSSIKYAPNSDEIEPSLIQVKLLLLLMETLDKQIHNAIEGTGYRIAPVSKAACSFFRTNKGTCYDWLARSRFSVIKLAAKCGEHELAWRNGCELLRHLVNAKASSAEIESCLLLVVEALIELEDSDSISGLLTWAKEILSMKCHWGRAVLKEASGHLDSAKSRYQEQLNALQNQTSDASSIVLNNNNSGGNSYLVDFFNRRINKCKQSISCPTDAANSSRTSPDKENCFASFIDDVDSLSIQNLKNLTEEFNNLTFDTEQIWQKSRTDTLQIISSSEANEEKFKVVTGNLKNAVKATVLTSGDVKSCSKFNLMLQVLNLSRNADPTASLTKLVTQTAQNTLGYESKQHWSRSDLMFLVECADSMSNEKSKNPVELMLYLSKTVRKTENFKLASSLLAFTASHLPSFVKSSSKDVPLMMELIRTLPVETEDASISLTKADQLLIVGEAGKVLKGLTDHRRAIDVMVSKFGPLCNSLKEETDPQVRKIHSENLLTLGKYLEFDGKYCEKVQTQNQLSLPSTDEFAQESYSSNLVARLYHASIHFNPNYGRAYLALANWSYKTCMSRISSSDCVEPSLDVNLLSSPEDDCTTAGDANDASEPYIVLALESFFKALSSGGIPETSASVVLKILKILSLPLNSDLVKGKIASLISECPITAWKSVTIQLFSYLTYTKDAFFKKLLTDILCRIGKESPQLVIFPALAGSLADKKNKLIVDISGEDRRAGTAGKRVFSDDVILEVDYDNQTGNPNEPTSDSSLTDRLANSSSNSTETNPFADVLSSSRASLYSSIVDVLTSQHPALISQTIQFINEMRRITVLWDELWVATLMYRLPELKKRVTLLEEEVERMNNTNCNLRKEAKIRHLSEKFFNNFNRLAGFFEEIKQVTVDQYPETPYEKWFQSTFSQQIVSLVTTLKDAENLTRPQCILQVAQRLLAKLQKKSHEISSGKSQLVMDIISPVLSSMSNTVVPVPGLRTQGVVISKIGKTITVLHTKTKPKRVTFVGSDGEMHNFLFKGHEDLHLDERIMQLLQITNQVLARGSKSMHANATLAGLYRARHYSVTPLGPKCGLIQWVDGGPAIYGFHRRWLLNKSATAETKAYEIFNKKLSEKKITSSNRSEWPKDVLIEIHKELTAETASDLISRELWFSSTSTRQFYHLTQSFIRSNAVMCMIGYIIGLGDRHLDNILLDLSTGEIIHVDYNVCFEKGKNLRVPERVPCRLTKSIVSAFGITGVNGSFKAHCEHVLNILRKERETILLILESFIHDPLYEWIVSAESTSTNTGTDSASTTTGIATAGTINSNINTGPLNNLTGTGLHGLSGGNKINPYAKKAWKRVKLKLEGREMDLNKKLTVPDQVESIIKQAMDVENLALMFEGWLSWV